MKALMYVALILDALCAVLLTAIVLLQSGKSAGLSGAIAGASESFMSKGGSKSWDAKLAKATKWVAIAFMVLTLVLSLLPTAAVAG